MKKIILLLILVLISAHLFAANMPTVLIYNAELISEADANDARLTIETLKFYVSKSEKFDSITYNVEMPTVLLAVKEKKLTADEVSLTANVNDKLKVAKILEFDYLLLPEIKKENQILEINVNTYDLKKNTLKSYGATTKVNEKQLTNSIHSAMSGIVVSMIRDVFNENPDFKVGEDVNQKEEETVDITTLSPKNLIGLGDDQLKANNIPQAIVLYTKAIDKDPDNPDFRLKLADAYFKKQMYKDALDQYYTAVNMGYRGNDIYTLKQKYESRVRIDDYVKPAEEIKETNETNDTKKDDVVLTPPKLSNASSEYDNEIVKMLSDTDAIWKKGNLKSAMTGYMGIIKKFPNDYRAYERLAILYANNLYFIDSSNMLKVINARDIDYDNVAVNNRINTLSAIVSAYYMKTINNLRYTGETLKKSGNKETNYNDLKTNSDYIYNSLILLNTMSSNRNNYNVTNIKLTGNLINSAISSLMDYVETGDQDALSSAQSFITQAELRIKQIRF